MKKIQLDCQNCLTHVQRKNLITGSFTGRNFISYEALLVFHRTKSPSGRSFFNAVFETALTVSRLNFWGDPFWDDSVILEFFLKMRGTKWTFAEKFRISCQYGIRHDQRNNSKGEKIWKKINISNIINLLADFRKSAQSFGQRCQNCNQRVQKNYLITFSEVFFLKYTELWKKKCSVSNEKPFSMTMKTRINVSRVIFEETSLRTLKASNDWRLSFD